MKRFFLVIWGLLSFSLLGAVLRELWIDPSVYGAFGLLLAGYYSFCFFKLVHAVYLPLGVAGFIPASWLLALPHPAASDTDSAACRLRGLGAWRLRRGAELATYRSAARSARLAAGCARISRPAAGALCVRDWHGGDAAAPSSWPGCTLSCSPERLSAARFCNRSDCRSLPRPPYHLLAPCRLWPVPTA